MTIDKIYKADGSQFVMFDGKTNQYSVADHEEEQMKSNFIRVTWNSSRKYTIPVGYYITIGGVKYRLFDEYQPDASGERTFKYSPQFEHPTMWTKHIPFLYVKQMSDYEQGDTPAQKWARYDKQSEWSFSDYAGRLIAYALHFLNLWGTLVDTTFGGEFLKANQSQAEQEAGLGGWTADVDSDIANTVINISFSAVDVFSALSQIAGQLDREFHIDLSTHTLYVGNISIGSSAYPLTIGTHVGAPSVSRNKEAYCNRYVVHGGTRNLTQQGVNGDNMQSTNRLTLPSDFEGSIIDLRESNAPTGVESTDWDEIKADVNEPAITGELVMDDVYPQVKFYIYDLQERLRKRALEGGGYSDETYATWYCRLAIRNGDSFTPYKLQDSVTAEVIAKGTNTYSQMYLVLDMKFGDGNQFTGNVLRPGIDQKEYGKYYVALSYSTRKAIVQVLPYNNGESTKVLLGDEDTAFYQNVVVKNASATPPVQGTEISFIKGVDSTKAPKENVHSDRIAGVTLQCSFLPNYEDGALESPLTGRTFDLVAYNEGDERETEHDDADTGQGIELHDGMFRVEFVEENTLVIPQKSTQTLSPKADPGSYVSNTLVPAKMKKNNIVSLIGIKAPAASITAAQGELLATAIDTIKRKRLDNNTYTVKSYPQVFNEDNISLSVGQAVTLSDGNGFSLTTHIRKLVTRLDHPSIVEITVGNEKRKGPISTLKEKVDTIVYYGGGSSSSVGGSGNGNAVSEAAVQKIIDKYGGDTFLSKTEDDTAQGLIGFVKGLWVKTLGLFGFDQYGNATAKSLTVKDDTSNPASTVASIDGDGDATLHDVTASGDLGVTGDAEVGGDLDVTGTTNGTDAIFENLTVTKAAHFFKLIIDEVKATQGQVIITAANAKLDKVVEVTGGWKCYFRSSDADGNEISNTFAANDLVLCQTFNAATGVSYNASNKYYWRKCTAVGSESLTVDGQAVDYHYIVLSSSVEDINSNADPQAGDEVVQLGNDTDTTRQAAIIISAYNNTYLDPAIAAPSIVQYDGINTFSLSGFRKNVISKTLNKFTGDFDVTINGNVSDLSQFLVNLNSVVSTVTKRVGKNILSITGWTKNNGELLTRDESKCGYTAAQNGTAREAFAPIMYLEAGYYCFSWYGEANIVPHYYWSTSKVTKPNDSGTSSQSLGGADTAAGETYNGNQRYYKTFQITAEQAATRKYFFMHLYKGNSDDFNFYRPMLEVVADANGVPSVWDAGVQEYGSIIKQTADSIDLGVRSDLGTVGIIINGNDKKIKLLADKVNFYDSTGANLNPKVWIDPTKGNIHAVDGEFEGTVRATNLFHSVCYFTEGNTIDNGEYYSNENSNVLYYYNADLVSETPPAGFVDGHYYTEEEIGEYKGDACFIPTTGKADVAMCMPRVGYNWEPDNYGNLPYIRLPKPEDFQGKVVEVSGFCYAENNSGTFVKTFGVRCVCSDFDPNDRRMSGLVYSDPNGYPSAPIRTVIPYTETVISTGGTARFMSVELSDGSWVWVLLANQTGGDVYIGDGSISGGTVTSVGMSVPTGFSVSPETITTNGTFAISFGGTLTKNRVLATPSSADGAPSWRSLVSGDIPSLAASKITSGTFDAARIPNISWNKITSDKPTTIAGYGITDAYISNGTTIYIGGNSITPITDGDLGDYVSVDAGGMYSHPMKTQSKVELHKSIYGNGCIEFYGGTTEALKGSLDVDNNGNLRWTANSATKRVLLAGDANNIPLHDSNGNWSGGITSMSGLVGYFHYVSAGVYELDYLPNGDVGVQNGKVLRLEELPGYDVIKANSNYNQDYNRIDGNIDPDDYRDEAYFKGLVRWAITEYLGVYKSDSSNITLIGSARPNSTGTVHIDLYGGSGRNPNADDPTLPMYCSGMYLTLSGVIFIFGTIEGAWYWRQINPASIDAASLGGIAAANYATQSWVNSQGHVASAGALKYGGNTKAEAGLNGVTVTGQLVTTNSVVAQGGIAATGNVDIDDDLNFVRIRSIYSSQTQERYVEFVGYGENDGTEAPTAYKFDSEVRATAFKKTGSSDDNVLLGGGGAQSKAMVMDNTTLDNLLAAINTACENGVVKYRKTTEQFLRFAVKYALIEGVGVYALDIPNFMVGGVMCPNPIIKVVSSGTTGRYLVRWLDVTDGNTTKLWRFGDNGIVMSDLNSRQSIMYSELTSICTALSGMGTNTFVMDTQSSPVEEVTLEYLESNFVGMAKINYV